MNLNASVPAISAYVSAAQVANSCTGRLTAYPWKPCEIAGAQRPVAIPPSNPGVACTGPTSQGSSSLSLVLSQFEVKGICAPAKSPMSTAYSGCTRCTPEQIATAPANPPFGVMTASALPLRQREMASAPVMPPEIAISVLIATNGRSVAMWPYDGTDPKLNPNQQNISRSEPSPIKGTLCPVVFGVRAPRKRAPTRPMIPPTACTPSEPA